jgi:hypothetical protein
VSRRAPAGLGEADTAFRAMFTERPADSATAFRWLAQLQMLRGRYGEALPMLQQASRLTRQAGDAQAHFDNLVLRRMPSARSRWPHRASELIDEAVAVAVARPVSLSGYFQLGHLTGAHRAAQCAREILRRQASAGRAGRRREPVADPPAHGVAAHRRAQWRRRVDQRRRA